jgi:6-pyruvoyl-tetrahydropterin synthase
MQNNTQNIKQELDVHCKNSYATYDTKHKLRYSSQLFVFNRMEALTLAKQCKIRLYETQNRWAVIRAATQEQIDTFYSLLTNY